MESVTITGGSFFTVMEQFCILIAVTVVCISDSTVH